MWKYLWLCLILSHCWTCEGSWWMRQNMRLKPQHKWKHPTCEAELWRNLETLASYWCSTTAVVLYCTTYLECLSNTSTLCPPPPLTHVRNIMKTWPTIKPVFQECKQKNVLMELLKSRNVGAVQKFNYSMIECWHFWGRRTGNSLNAAEQPGRETPAAVKESASLAWLWNGSLLGSRRRSLLSQSWTVWASTTTALAVLIENNPPGTGLTSAPRVGAAFQE